MSRWVYALMLSCLPLAAGAHDRPAQKSQPAAQQPQVQEPPEEDANLKPQVYAFNPVQAKKELDVGDEYYKKHSYKAAAGRYLEATRWNPNFAEAWLKLGEAQDKRRYNKDAKEAYTKYLQLQPDAKDAARIRKRIAELR